MAIERVGTHNTNREIETVRFMYSPLSALSKLYTLVNVATYKSPLSFSILCSVLKSAHPFRGDHYSSHSSYASTTCSLSSAVCDVQFSL